MVILLQWAALRGHWQSIADRCQPVNPRPAIASFVSGGAGDKL
jgi:hypothetical protein